MSYENMKRLMALLDEMNINYEYGNYYSTERFSDGTATEYINGHWIKLPATIIETDEIDDKDDRWNRG